MNAAVPRQQRLGERSEPPRVHLRFRLDKRPILYDNFTHAYAIIVSTIEVDGYGIKRMDMNLIIKSVMLHSLPDFDLKRCVISH